jgi:hypothetical protein
MIFFIPFNTFLGAVKLHIFRKKILDTLGDALLPNYISGRTCFPKQLWHVPGIIHIFAQWSELASHHCLCST